ncbi:hypothetical protein NDU88_006062 [Pleurodeles waltl]|uniref:Uncharacterized protein n=1 Tax=Pleurodeles waltl TaxID=8319 RepID=A0AAV7VQ06_PLEWA|nr:hypothetical protein NDU88_006062 [Pleurodeles waltl]
MPTWCIMRWQLQAKDKTPDATAEEEKGDISLTSEMREAAALWPLDGLSVAAKPSKHKVGKRGSPVTLKERKVARS